MSVSASEYKDFHVRSMEIGDCDPAYPMLRYVCDRFELNVEQRFWVAFLYAATYCGPTAFYIYNEFPDLENVDFGRLERWWSANKDKAVFQTDRKWVKINNAFVRCVKSYSSVVGKCGQQKKFDSFKTPNPRANYVALFEEFSRVDQFGRYSMFLFLEAVHVVTGFPMEPPSIDLKESESTLNGLCYALGRPDMLVGKRSGAERARQRLAAKEYAWLHNMLLLLQRELRAERPEFEHTIWNLETTLCAYKKFRKGERYVGYYIDRQAAEIRRAEGLVRSGVDWSVLWDFRREFFRKEMLTEAEL